MPSVFGGAARAAVEGFLDTGNAEKRRNAYADFVAIVLTYILGLVILSFIGKLLWNGVIVDLVKRGESGTIFTEMLSMQLAATSGTSVY